MPESGAQVLEQEISELEQALASKRAVLEKQLETGEISEVPHEKEVLRGLIGGKITPQPPISSSQLPTPSPPPPASSFQPSYLSPELKDKVQALINSAFTRSIDDAIREAKASNNAALIDAFHDALADELYGHLVERGKLKKL